MYVRIVSALVCACTLFARRVYPVGNAMVTGQLNVFVVRRGCEGRVPCRCVCIWDVYGREFDVW